MKFIILAVVALIVILFILLQSKYREADDLRAKVSSLTSTSDNYQKSLFSAKHDIQELKQQNDALSKGLAQANAELIRHEQNIHSILDSHLVSMPWLAAMMADYLTYDLEVEAKKIDWGYDIKRQKKVASIREIRADACRRIEEAKLATYQLAYLKELYPELSDILETDFSDLDLSGEPTRSDRTEENQDPVQEYLSNEEWATLPEDEKNQLALDRYIDSRRKSKWQIGRDYELSIAYMLTENGFIVDSTGSYLRLEDLGRDIIARKGEKTYVIQCKYWSEAKQIHEKHIFQLFGTSVAYSIDHPSEQVVPLFVTNIHLSPTAKKAAELLKVIVRESVAFAEFPRIKCNIGHNEFGSSTKIYHLPIDPQYDVTQIKNPGECYAFTVREAVQKGFRRTYKWCGN